MRNPCSLQSGQLTRTLRSGLKSSLPLDAAEGALLGNACMLLATWDFGEGDGNEVKKDSTIYDD